MAGRPPREHQDKGKEKHRATPAGSSLQHGQLGDEDEDDKSEKHDISFLLNQGKSSKGAKDSQSRAQASSSLSGPTTPSEKKRWCAVCKKYFAQPADLKKHWKCVHLKERPFVCEHCGAKFGEKGNLNRHLKSVHTNERPWPCSQCGLQFAFKDTLTRHISAVHHDVRPYKCEICLSSFKKRDHLTRHQEALHGVKKK